MKSNQKISSIYFRKIKKARNKIFIAVALMLFGNVNFDQQLSGAGASAVTRFRAAIIKVDITPEDP